MVFVQVNAFSSSQIIMGAIIWSRAGRLFVLFLGVFSSVLGRLGRLGRFGVELFFAFIVRHLSCSLLGCLRLSGSCGFSGVSSSALS